LPRAILFLSLPLPMDKGRQASPEAKNKIRAEEAHRKPGVQMSRAFPSPRVPLFALGALIGVDAIACREQAARGEWGRVRQDHAGIAYLLLSDVERRAGRLFSDQDAVDAISRAQAKERRHECKRRRALPRYTEAEVRRIVAQRLMTARNKMIDAFQGQLYQLKKGELP